MTDEEMLAIYRAGPETVVKALRDLSQRMELLQAQVDALQREASPMWTTIAKLSEILRTLMD